METFRSRIGKIRTAAGFTLMELMVVMLMITILMAVAIPRFEGGFAQDANKQLTRRMIHTVRILRNQAVQQQKRFSLIIDLDNQRFWTESPASEEQLAMDEFATEQLDGGQLAEGQLAEEQPTTVAQKAYDLPKSIRFVEIQFPQRNPIHSGKAEIFFYPAGYSDHAVVHVQTEDQERFSYMVEPLLPKIRLNEEWIDL